MILFFLFFIFLFIYAVFSYSLVDPNLVLSSNPIYWNFQNWMWSIFFSNGRLMAYVYFAVIVSLFIIYTYILTKLKDSKIIPKHVFKNKYILYFLILIFPLLISYNALSHDVFNYIFNSRMIVEYGADPHVSVALDFPNDLWTRFMHNTHTPAPYGKGWTYMSLIPYLLGFGKFTLTLVSFRIWSLVSIFLLYFSLQNFSKRFFKRNLNLYELALVFLNPLLLIEVISNYHNDLWMMFTGVLGLSYLLLFIDSAATNKTFSNLKKFAAKTKINKQFLENFLNKKNYFLIISFALLLFSISIKLASLALFPIWLIVISINIFSTRLSDKFSNKFKINIPTRFIEQFVFSFVKKFVKYIPDLAAVLMFIPLFTLRSQQFLPWYILWVLVWIPFMNIKLLKNLVLVFTFSSALRYLPWLANNMEFNDNVIRNQKLVTWGLPLLYLIFSLKRKESTKSKFRVLK